MKGDQRKCLEAGGDDYLSKPIQRKILLETISKYLVSGKEESGGKDELNQPCFSEKSSTE